MNIIGKIIGLIAFVLMILLIVNYKTLLPYFDNIALGGGSLSPAQIGASYVDQANTLSPYNSMTGGDGARRSGFTYGEYLAAQQSGKSNGPRGTITVQKIDNLLVLTTENIRIPPSNQKIHIWLTNKSTITDTTKFINFGPVKNNDDQSYTVNLGDDISLTEYKHVMIINIEDYTIYGQSVLSK